MSDPDVPINKESNDSFPGGPEDSSVLTTFKSHIAASIWMKKYRPPLKCLNHACKVAEWHFDEQKGNMRFRNTIMHSGLSILSKCSYRYINRTLISAFVERWHPETNTFHLPFGEMTITLHDLFMITGIPITGRLVSLPTLDYEDVESLVVSALGVSKEEAYEELSLVRGQLVRLEWLKERFSNINRSSDESLVDYAARAYLLYLLGGTLFSDKSGGRVSVVYLNLLMDLDRVHEYAWGSATLAYLYRQLGCATRSGVKQISGFLTLLEAWIYEHIPAYRPNRNLAYIDNLPRVSRWIPRRETGAKLEYLKATREALDMLRVNRRLSRALCIVDDTLDKGSDQFELDLLYDIIADIGSALHSQTSNIMKTCKLRRSVNLEKTPTSANGVKASCRKYSCKKKIK